MDVIGQMRLPDSVAERAPVAGGAADLADADALIADLAALVEAGLVLVHEHVLGPARYGLAPEPEGGAERAGRPRPIGIARARWALETSRVA